MNILFTIRHGPIFISIHIWIFFFSFLLELNDSIPLTEGGGGLHFFFPVESEALPGVKCVLVHSFSFWPILEVSRFSFFLKVSLKH